MDNSTATKQLLEVVDFDPDKFDLETITSITNWLVDWYPEMVPFDTCGGMRHLVVLDNIDLEDLLSSLDTDFEGFETNFGTIFQDYGIGNECSVVLGVW